MLTTVQPIALAELRQSVWFSFFSHRLSTLLVLMARSSMVPGTAKLMSLLDGTTVNKKTPSDCSEHQSVGSKHKVHQTETDHRSTPSLVMWKM